MKRIIFALTLLNGLSCYAQNKYQADFEYYWQTVRDNFAYFDRQKIDWNKAHEIFEKQAVSATNDDELLHLLERANNELYNGHVFLNRNNMQSYRPIPTGADIKVIKRGADFIVDEVRIGFSADKAGVKRGMKVVAVNSVPIETALKPLLPVTSNGWNNEMYEYAANTLLAGTHDAKRKITLNSNGKEITVEPNKGGNKTEERYSSVVEAMMLEGNIGYVKINNSLGDNELIHAFDSVMKLFAATSGLIVDLRETPSGGTTITARAIMGRFTEAEVPYQRHIYTAEERETGIRRVAVEYVSPRQPVYKKPVVVLVGYWTGSMGEGMAVGLDHMKNVKVMGTQMARLLGEIYSFETPTVKIPFSFPCVKLEHVNGTPREDYMPAIIVKDPGKALDEARKYLSGKAK